MGVLTCRLPLLLFALAVLLSAGSVAAQGRIMLLHDPRVKDDARVGVSDALSGFSRVGVDRFVQAADAKRLDPLSDAAFSRALPSGLVDVAIVLLPARRGLTMVLRSGRDGTVLSQHALKLRRGKLRRKALKSIPRFVQDVMAKLPPESDRESEHAPNTLAEQQAAMRADDDDVADDRPVDAESALGEQNSDGGESVDATDASEPVDAPEPRVLRLHVDLGTGLATRSLAFPIEAGEGSLSLGPSAALDVGLEAAYDPPTAVSWALQLRYQTTVGARLDEHQIGGVERPMGIRSARFEALFVPGFDLSEALQLRFAIGYGLRGLRTDVHDQELSTVHSLRTPDFTLSGPVAGMALRLALGDSVALTLAPEAQLLVTVGSDLKQRGVAGGGFAFGGTASLVVSLGQALSVYVAYRQAHARIAGVSGHANVSDGERYITAGFRGAL
jgi:hypothetical protein